MDKKQAYFEEVIKRGAGSQMADATNITNSAISMIHNRSNDMDVNPLITFLMVKRLAEKNIDHLKKQMLHDPQMQLLAKIFGRDIGETISRMETMVDNIVKVGAREEKI